MRIVRRILDRVTTDLTRDPICQLRINVLAWCPIRPIQLDRLDPSKDFHDVPDATRADMIGGAVSVLMPHHFKGRRDRIPERQLMPLTPYGVAAMRAFAAEPRAWGSAGRPDRKAINVPYLNELFRAACVRAQAALKSDGVDVDLSAMTLYKLKHSQATAMQIAAPGLTDRNGDIRIDAGVQATTAHARPGMTKVYTLAAVAPLLKVVCSQTSRYLDGLLATPLTPPAALRRVK